MLDDKRLEELKKEAPGGFVDMVNCIDGLYIAYINPDFDLFVVISESLPKDQIHEILKEYSNLSYESYITAK